MIVDTVRGACRVFNADVAVSAICKWANTE